jgi:hypothetical protein
MLSAQRHHELLIGLLLTRLVENTHVGLATIESFAGFSEATRESVMDQGRLQHAFQSFQNAHLPFAGGGVGCHGGFVTAASGGGSGGLFSVRLWDGRGLLERW